MEDNSTDNKPEKQAYGMVFIIGILYILLLGLFTLLFNNPI